MTDTTWAVCDDCGGGIPADELNHIGGEALCDECALALPSDPKYPDEE